MWFPGSPFWPHWLRSREEEEEREILVTIVTIYSKMVFVKHCVISVYLLLNPCITSVEHNTVHQKCPFSSQSPVGFDSVDRSVA